MYVCIYTIYTYCENFVIAVVVIYHSFLSFIVTYSVRIGNFSIDSTNLSRNENV